MSATDNSLEMSDEDFLNAPMPSAAPQEAVDDHQHVADDAAVADAPADEPAATDPVDEPVDDEPAESDTDPLGEPDDATPARAAAEKGAPQEDKGAKKPDAPEPVTKEDPPKEVEKPTEAQIDYKTEYEKLLAPFKANGKDFTVKSVEDAKSLMQMGANYSKKMAQLKPHLKMVKSLEQAGLLSEEKISYMIDLMSKAPGAINKLVKDQGIDPMELDADKAGEYQAGNHSVSDAEMDLDEVMNDLQDSPKVGDLISLVTKQLDHASKVEIKKEPAILRVLDSHMNSGVYDVIMEELDRETTLGRLKNVPMLQAYKQIGDAIQARGGFDKLFKGKTPEPVQAPTPPKEVTPPKSSKVEQDKLNEKRRAASSNRPVVANAPVKPAKETEMLGMSDADFLKLGVM